MAKRDHLENLRRKDKRLFLAQIALIFNQGIRTQKKILHTQSCIENLYL